MRLIPAALLTGILSFALAGSAHAQFELTWDKCPGSMGAAANKLFACDDAAQPMVLIAAFTPQKSLPRFVGLQFWFEIASSTDALPDWWRVGAGECRDGAVTTSNSPGNTLGQCQNPWSGARTGGGSLWTSSFGSNRALFQMVYAREEKTALSSGTRYYGGTITIDPAGSSSGTCGGCNTEVCIAITEVWINQEKDPSSPYDQPGPDDEIKVTHTNGANVASFNARNPGSNPCGAKTRNKTWGQVKATYRR